ncbi:MAG: hypothetical protein M3P33_00455 [bacterium]|nr:hypothetical protein [bacterium]
MEDIDETSGQDKKENLWRFSHESLTTEFNVKIHDSVRERAEKMGLDEDKVKELTRYAIKTVERFFAGITGMVDEDLLCKD